MKPIINFNFLGLTLQTWGFCFALASLLSFLLLIKEAKRKKISVDLAYNLYFIGFFSGIIGARIFYFIIHPEFFSAFTFLHFWQGGYILFGGAFLSLLCVILYLYFKKKPIFEILDILVLPLLVALIIIRFGSFLTQDNIGQTTSLPWAINFLGEKRHPIDLYFIALDLALLGLAFYLKQKKIKKILFWVILFLSIGRLAIHKFATFINNLDANLDIAFWSLALLASLVLLGYNAKEASESALKK